MNHHRSLRLPVAFCRHLSNLAVVGAASLGFLLGSSQPCRADAPRTPTALAEGARLAVIGDSITEQKLYSKYIEAYLIACAGRKDVRVFQYGWGGEQAVGFAARLKNDLAGFAPTAVTLCYGMNDGHYQPFNEEIGRAYETAMRDVLKQLGEVGVRTIVVGTPGAVDTKYFVRNNFGPKSGADGYNDNLNKLGMIGKKLSGETNQLFANVHQAMIDAMTKAKPALGDDYDVCGPDGFHPGPNGHLIMAYAFLRALGCDGKIAEISVDMQGTATASDGHKVLNSSAGSAEIESERYPFCFQGDPKSSRGTRSITPFFPFNEELNRFTLKVANLQQPKAQVQWGAETKEFTREQLAGGINLAAEFAVTPFDASFNRYLEGVAAKQNLETIMIKNLINSFRNFQKDAQDDPELAAAMQTVAKRLTARQKDSDDKARQMLAPIRHTIKVTPAP